MSSKRTPAGSLVPGPSCTQAVYTGSLSTLGDVTHALARSEEMVQAQSELFASLSAQHGQPPPASTRWRPILRADRLVGLWTVDGGAGASSFFIRPAERRLGVGDDVVEQLAERGHD